MSMFDLIKKFSKEVAALVLYKFVGNNLAYLQLASTYNMGTSHYVEFEAILDNASNDRLLGQNASADDYMAPLAGGTLRYRANAQNLNFDGLTFDASFHKYRLERSGLSVNLYVDDVGHPDNPLLLSTDDAFHVDRVFTYNTAIFFNGECKYMDLNGVNVYTFTPPSTVVNFGPISATIQNDDGNRIQPI